MFSHMSTSLVVNRSSKERTWQFCLLERGLCEFCSQTSRIRYQDTHKVLLFPAVVPPDPMHSLHRQRFLSVPLAALTSSNPLFSLPCFSLHVSLSLPSSPSHTGPEDSPSRDIACLCPVGLCALRETSRPNPLRQIRLCPGSSCMTHAQVRLASYTSGQPRS